MAEERKLPLQGLKVVELGTHFAVPSVTRMLADWGAEVIKVENVKGDAWRIVGRNQKCRLQMKKIHFSWFQMQIRSL